MTVPGLTDSHCHLDLTASQLETDIGSLIGEALNNGLVRLVHISTNLESFLTVEPLLHDYPDTLSVTLGLMPGEPPLSLTDNIMEIMEKRQICAIGEIGLDYYCHPEKKEEQQTLFRLQLEQAQACNLPVVIHNRDADRDLLGILAKYPGIRGVVHCFTGDAVMAEALSEMGLHISFSGIVTFNSAGKIREAARILPPERILVETDAPYLSPVPLRGKTNLPWHVVHTVRFLAELRGESPETVAAYTRSNMETLFGLR